MSVWSGFVLIEMLIPACLRCVLCTIKLQAVLHCVCFQFDMQSVTPPTPMQYADDLKLPPAERQWLACEISADGFQVIMIICTAEQRAWALLHGHGKPCYMDATHGMQRYGLKVVTLHVKDKAGFGMQPFLFHLCNL